MRYAASTVAERPRPLAQWTRTVRPSATCTSIQSTASVRTPRVRDADVRHGESPVRDAVGLVEREVRGALRPHIEDRRDPVLKQRVVITPVRRRATDPEARRDLREPGMSEHALVREPDRRVQLVERPVERVQRRRWLRGTTMVSADGQDLDLDGCPPDVLAVRPHGLVRLHVDGDATRLPKYFPAVAVFTFRKRSAAATRLSWFLSSSMKQSRSPSSIEYVWWTLRPVPIIPELTT